MIRNLLYQQHCRPAYSNWLLLTKTDETCAIVIHGVQSIYPRPPFQQHPGGPLSKMHAAHALRSCSNITHSATHTSYSTFQLQVYWQYTVNTFLQLLLQSRHSVAYALISNQPQLPIGSKAIQASTTHSSYRLKTNTRHPQHRAVVASA